MNKEAFFDAIREGDVAAVRLALHDEPRRAELRWEAADGEEWVAGATPLTAAAHSGSMQMVELVLAAGVDPALTHEDSCGRRNPAHEAYEHHGVELCWRFLRAGVPYDINLAAALGDFARVAELLHDDPGLVADMSTGLSPLGWAGYGQNHDMIPYLAQRGAPYRGEICCSAEVGNTDHTRAFLDAGADPNMPMEGSDQRPLHCAAAMPHTDSNEEVVSLLIAAGAQVNGRNDQGETPLDIARARLAATRDADMRAGYEGVIRVLESHGGLAAAQLD